MYAIKELDGGERLACLPGFYAPEQGTLCAYGNN